MQSQANTNEAFGTSLKARSLHGKKDGESKNLLGKRYMEEVEAPFKAGLTDYFLLDLLSLPITSPMSEKVGECVYERVTA